MFFYILKRRHIAAFDEAKWGNPQRFFLFVFFLKVFQRSSLLKTNVIALSTIGKKKTS